MHNAIPLRMCRRKSGTHCGCNIAENDRFAGERILYPKLRFAVPDLLRAVLVASLSPSYRENEVVHHRRCRKINGGRQARSPVLSSGRVLNGGPGVAKGHALSRGARPAPMTTRASRVSRVCPRPYAPSSLVNSCTCRPPYGPSPRIFALKYTHTCA